VATQPKLQPHANWGQICPQFKIRDTTIYKALQGSSSKTIDPATMTMMMMKRRRRVVMVLG
jgi:hypothetical protein